MPSAPPLPGTATLAAAIAELLPDAIDSPGESGRRAAVLILLYDVAGEPHVILTKRSDGLPHHPGQISLPGGRFEDADGDLATTALREVHEELGIPPESVRILGRLGNEVTAVSGFVVTPFVGVADEPPEPVPAEEEIARVMEVPLASLLAADAELPAKPDVFTLRYPLLDEDVWGATARMLRAFSGVVRRAAGAVG